MAKITCNVIRDLLELYVDGALSDDTRALVDEHLHGCEDCKSELEKLKKPLTLPTEGNSAPFDEIRRRFAWQNTLVWTLALALIAIFFVMSLPIFDTAMQYHIGKLIGGGFVNLLLMTLPLALVGFAIEWGLLHLKRLRLFALIPISLSALIIVWSELGWAAQGRYRFGSSILWYIGFPILIGAGTAAIIKAAIGQPRWVKITLASIVGVFIVIVIIFIPRPLAEVIGFEPDELMLMISTDSGHENDDTSLIFIEKGRLAEELNGARIYPCRSAHRPDGNRYILVRLNKDYILAAPYGETPYIYEYSGELENFLWLNVRYRVYNLSAMYTNLRAAGKSVDLDEYTSTVLPFGEKEYVLTPDE